MTSDLNDHFSRHERRQTLLLKLRSFNLPLERRKFLLTRCRVCRNCQYHPNLYILPLFLTVYLSNRIRNCPNISHIILKRSSIFFSFTRCYVSVAVLGNLIYAMGGYDGHHRQNTAEKYNYKYNQWSLIASMNVQRSDASATALNSK